jgi:hypothetical protein
LVLQDVLTLHGSQFRNASLIVASPPCQEFSYMAMPFSRGKQIAAALRGQGEFPPGYTGSRTIAELTALFDACFRLQREASEAAGRHIPLVVENVKGAQPWLGRAKWHYGSYYLWGDIPALMPTVTSIKNWGGSWLAIGSPGQTNVKQNPDGRKIPIKNPGQNWSRYKETGEVSPHWNVSAVKQPDLSGPVWFDKGAASLPSSSPRRKAASALIAKIPLPLARHIAAVYYPHDHELQPAKHETTHAR